METDGRGGGIRTRRPLVPNQDGLRPQFKPNSDEPRQFAQKARQLTALHK